MDSIVCCISCSVGGDTQGNPPPSIVPLLYSSDTSTVFAPCVTQSPRPWLAEYLCPVVRYLKGGTPGVVGGLILAYDTLTFSQGNSHPTGPGPYHTSGYLGG